jgi:hypothetical protein
VVIKDVVNFVQACSKGLILLAFKVVVESNSLDTSDFDLVRARGWLIYLLLVREGL